MNSPHGKREEIRIAAHNVIVKRARSRRIMQRCILWSLACLVMFVGALLIVPSRGALPERIAATRARSVDQHNQSIPRDASADHNIFSAPLLDAQGAAKPHRANIELIDDAQLAQILTSAGIQPGIIRIGGSRPTVIVEAQIIAHAEEFEDESPAIQEEPYASDSQDITN